MKKILVTTDLSTHSKAALRFAGQLATQDEITLVILHVICVMRPTTWHQATYVTYEKSELAKAKETLDRFIASIYNDPDIEVPDYTCVVENSAFTDSAIMAYAADHHIDYICMSTRGAGMFEKLFGTTTANLINQSSIPVIVVPGNYRASKLTSVLYASDLSRLEPELKHVINFTRPLAVRVSLVHFSMPSEPVIDPAIIRKIAQTISDDPIEVQTKAFDLTKSMISQIELVIKKAKPSMIIMFTRQNEVFFIGFFRLATPSTIHFKPISHCWYGVKTSDFKLASNAGRDQVERLLSFQFQEFSYEFPRCINY